MTAAQNRQRRLTMFIRTLTLTYAVIGLQICGLGQAPFDFARIRELKDTSSGVPAAERLARSIALLKEECTIVRKPLWGAAGGPVDSGYIQSVVTGTVAFVGSELPDKLREFRNREADPNVKDCLTIAMGEIGEQAVIPDLLRLALKDREGAIRQNAVIALGRMALPNQPTLPGPWSRRKPLTVVDRTAIANALMAALADPFGRYHKANRTNPSRYDAGTGRWIVGTNDLAPDMSSLYYPVQNQAAEGLQLLGYRVKQQRVGDLVGGWWVFDKEGRVVHNVKLQVPVLRHADDPKFD
jgi:hypothetical protein